MKIDTVKEFSETPGARYKDEGNYSGEEFREDILIPKYELARKNDEKLSINLDGGYGYPPSFLEEAFGGMVRRGCNKDDILKRLEFISTDDPSLEGKIKEYILNAEKESL